MAIVNLGLLTSKKNLQKSPTGVQRYLVESDEKITTDQDIILTAVWGTGIDQKSIPAYNSSWDLTGNTNLKVTLITCDHADPKGDVMEGYVWHVTVNYTTATVPSIQTEEDPVDRGWTWTKSGEKVERVADVSLFDTDGHEAPGVPIENNFNLIEGSAITNTAGDTPESGIGRMSSLTAISFSRYVNNYSGLGSITSWADLDEYRDTLNSADITILDIEYPPWTVLMDDITYTPYTEGDFECFQVSFKLLIDTEFTHVFAFPNLGFNELIGGNSRRIQLDSGGDTSNPSLLDIDGSKLEIPALPDKAVPIIVSAGVNKLRDLSNFDFPESV